MSTIKTLSIIGAVLLSACNRQANVTGKYMAYVHIEDGEEYRVPVEIERNVVRQVEWPNGGNMCIVKDGLLESDSPGDNGYAVGWNSRGEVVGISPDWSSEIK